MLSNDFDYFIDIREGTLAKTVSHFELGMKESIDMLDDLLFLVVGCHIFVDTRSLDAFLGILFHNCFGHFGTGGEFVSLTIAFEDAFVCHCVL